MPQIIIIIDELADLMMVHRARWRIPSAVWPSLREPRGYIW